jgi:hypothetical protein
MPMPTMPEPTLASFVFPPKLVALASPQLPIIPLERRSPYHSQCIWYSKVLKTFRSCGFNNLKTISKLNFGLQLKMSAHLQHPASISWKWVGCSPVRESLRG